jgi:hypothetical protein
MIVKRLPIIIRKLMPDVEAITIAPLGIFHRDKKMPWTTLNHEMIHWEQQIEMIIIPFYLWYGIEWLVKLPRYGRNAYYLISFEKEAYQFDNDGRYLMKRKHYSWIKYL